MPNAKMRCGLRCFPESDKNARATHQLECWKIACTEWKELKSRLNTPFEDSSSSDPEVLRTASGVTFVGSTRVLTWTMVMQEQHSMRKIMVDCYCPEQIASFCSSSSWKNFLQGVSVLKNEFALTVTAASWMSDTPSAWLSLVADP